MHRKVDESEASVKAAPMADELVSLDPATGEEVWSGAVGNAAAEVAAARAAWPE